MFEPVLITLLATSVPLVLAVGLLGCLVLKDQRQISKLDGLLFDQEGELVDAEHRCKRLQAELATRDHREAQLRQAYDALEQRALHSQPRRPAHARK